MTRRPVPNVFGRLTPGSAEARRDGCTCSSVRNNYGRGTGDRDNPIYDVDDACPRHAGGRAPDGGRS